VVRQATMLARWAFLAPKTLMKFLWGHHQHTGGGAYWVGPAHFLCPMSFYHVFHPWA